MSEPILVDIPLLNPNEPEAQLADLQVANGQKVSKGDLLCTLETTKATFELAAKQAGYVVGLRANVGDMLRAGERLCWLADDKDWKVPDEPKQSSAKPEQKLPKGLRISDPALALARKAGIGLSKLPKGPLVTASVVRQYLKSEPSPGFKVPDETFDSRALIIYGGGGHGKSLIDLIRALGNYDLKGVRLAANAVGGIGDIMSRVRVFERILEVGFDCPTLIHPTAYIEPSACLSTGAQIFPHAYVGSDAVIEFGAIINTGAVVSHDCRIGSYANLAPGSILAGNVTVGERVLIGMGVTVNLNVTIGAGSRVGNGAVVKRDIPPGKIIHAGSVWPATSANPEA
jgi:sugar O-acyltransferase (sialic acid O-acetyltransferase NeuD family)